MESSRAYVPDDLGSTEFLVDPYPLYRAFRDGPPVYNGRDRENVCGVPPPKIATRWPKRLRSATRPAAVTPGAASQSDAIRSSPVAFASATAPPSVRGDSTSTTRCSRGLLRVVARIDTARSSKPPAESIRSSGSSVAREPRQAGGLERFDDPGEAPVREAGC